MHTLGLIQDLSVIMIVAGIATLLFRMMKQPVILGYILAGLIVGPHTFPYPLVGDEQSIKSIAEIGVVLLMFGLGLHFSIRRIMKVGAAVFVAALVEISLSFFTAFKVAKLFGMTLPESVMIGIICSISSTMLIVKSLQETGMMKEEFAESIFGILIFEDIFSIGILAMLSGAANLGVSGSAINLDASLAVLGKLILFIVAVSVVGLLVVPKILSLVSKFKNDEMLLIGSLALCFAVSLIAAKLNYSIALGAFLAGAIVSETRQGAKISHLIAPVRDVFSAIFFVSMGMLINPFLLGDYILPILLVTALVIVFKTIFCTGSMLLLGNSPRASVQAGGKMAQIGEFSIIIAQHASASGVTSVFIYPVTVICSMLTAFLNPPLGKLCDFIADTGGRILPARYFEVIKLYDQWLDNFKTGKRGTGSAITPYKIIRRIVLMIFLDVILITAVLVGIDSLAKTGAIRNAGISTVFGTGRTIIWFVAMILALPLFVHLFSKLRSFSLIAAEAGLSNRVSGKRFASLFPLFSGIILSGLSLLISVWFVMLAITMLPPWPALVLMAVLLIIFATVRAQGLRGVYAKAQLQIQELFSAQSSNDEPSNFDINWHTEVFFVRNIPAMLGKNLRELSIRANTGASVIEIVRKNEKILNPSPDETLIDGDSLVLFGTPDQLAVARKFLAALKTSNWQS